MTAGPGFVKAWLVWTPKMFWHSRIWHFSSDGCNSCGWAKPNQSLSLFSLLVPPPPFSLFFLSLSPPSLSSLHITLSTASWTSLQYGSLRLVELFTWQLASPRASNPRNQGGSFRASHYLIFKSMHHQSGCKESAQIQCVKDKGMNSREGSVFGN